MARWRATSVASVHISAPFDSVCDTPRKCGLHQSIDRSGYNMAAAVKSAKTVAIIGGGVAGLQAARAASGYGFKTVVFEQSTDIGGVWRSNYHNFGVQVPKEFYEFPDFPFDLPRGELAPDSNPSSKPPPECDRASPPPLSLVQDTSRPAPRYRATSRGSHRSTLRPTQ
jgi:phytoene dehydrogenase-like protein